MSSNPSFLIGLSAGTLVLAYLIFELRRQKTKLESRVATLISELGRQAGAFEAEKELRLRNEAFLEMLAEQSPVGLLAMDGNGVITWAAGSCPRSNLPRVPEDLVGLNVSAAFPGLEDDLRKALAGNIAVAEVQTRGRVTRIRLGPRFDAAGRVAGVIGIIGDVTGREADDQTIEIGESVAELAEDTKAADAGRSRFVAILSHEIRTPVAGILGLSELLLLESRLPETARECAERLVGSATRLASLLSQMLDLTEIESGSLALEEQEFEVIEAFGEVQAAMAPKARAKGLELQSKLIGDLPAVNGDRARWLQVLSNLVDEAIELASEGSVAVSIERMASSSDTGPGVRCAVTVPEPGLSPENRARLFDPSAWSLEAVSRVSEGLGLAVSKGIVELMGGEISFENTPGGGATVAFTTRFSPAGSNRDADMGGEGSARKTSPHGSRILVVEDDNVNRLVILQLLKVLGHAPIGVVNGIEALGTLAENDFDLMLVDCKMSGLDGYETTKAHRQRETNGQHLPIIALTADAKSGNRDKCLAAGMDDFLIKPVSKLELREVIDRWVPAGRGESEPRTGMSH